MRETSFWLPCGKRKEKANGNCKGHGSEGAKRALVVARRCSVTVGESTSCRPCHVLWICSEPARPRRSKNTESEDKETGINHRPPRGI